MSGNIRKKRSIFAVARWILAFLLAAALLCALLAAVYVDRMLGLIERPVQQLQTLSAEEIYGIENETDPPDPTFTGPVIDPAEVTWATEPVEIIQGENVIHILLIGQDRRSGQSRQRSDAMILCTINKAEKTLFMTSFLRDLYVQIPGYQDNKLNAAYALGGMELLNETLALNFGIQAEGCIEVDFSRFSQLVDMLGGVDIVLTAQEAAHLNRNEGTALHAGMNHLNGKTALAYSRIRYIGTDFGRTNRQRTVLSAMIDQCGDLSVAELHNFLTEALPLITTDLSNGEILEYAVELLPMLSQLDISTQYIPAEGTYQYASVRGMSVLLPDLEAN